VSQYVKYTTKMCIVCKNMGVITLWADDVDRYLNGAMVQDAFPDLMAPAREQIVSGTHPECWNKLFEDDDD